MEIHRIAEGNVSVYLRHLKGGERYYARFKIANKKVANGQRYVTEALATDNLTVALDKARTRFAEINVLERQGRAIRSRSTAEQIDLFVADYEDGVKRRLSGFSPNMLRGFKKTIVRYFREFFGRKALQEITYDDMVGYESWRQNYWTLAKQKSKKLHPNARERASPRTLAWEVNAFKQFLRWCQTRGLYSGNAIDFQFNRGVPATRSAFTPAQWNKLTGYMRRNEWLQVGKKGNDSRLIRHRKMLQAYVLFLANTGLRVGEARNLRWRDVRFLKGKTDSECNLQVTVSASSSKVRKRREVVGTEGAYNALYRLLKERESTSDNAAPEDFIWCDPEGKVINEFREGFNTLLRGAKVEHDSEGRKLTLYCLRHSYITLRLKAGVDIYQLATNCGTSVQMIEQYYAHATSPDFTEELTKGYRNRHREA